MNEWPAVLDAYSVRYPRAEAVDYGKLLTQHLVGNGHAVSGLDAVRSRLIAEWPKSSSERPNSSSEQPDSSSERPVSLSAHREEPCENIGNDWIRLNLAPLPAWLVGQIASCRRPLADRGHEPVLLAAASLALARLFVASAERRPPADLPLNRHPDWVSRLAELERHLDECKCFPAASERHPTEDAQLLADYTRKPTEPDCGWSADLGSWRRFHERWSSEGYPVPRHSTAYRAAYAPNYRIVDSRLAASLPLLALIEAWMSVRGPTERLSIAIEGPCGSGKSELAGFLAAQYHAPVIRIDDFFLQPEQRTPERFTEPGGNFDRERFQSEVVIPWLAGRTPEYRVFDCKRMRFTEQIRIPDHPLLLVEGSYSHHPSIADAWDIRVFLDLSAAEQTARLRRREGDDGVGKFVERWIPLENAYFRSLEIRRRADLMLPQRIICG